MVSTAPIVLVPIFCAPIVSGTGMQRDLRLHTVTDSQHLLYNVRG